MALIKIDDVFPKGSLKMDSESKREEIIDQAGSFKKQLNYFGLKEFDLLDNFGTIVIEKLFKNGETPNDLQLFLNNFRNSPYAIKLKTDNLEKECKLLKEIERLKRFETHYIMEWELRHQRKYGELERVIIPFKEDT